jgi:hypothetical protein
MLGRVVDPIIRVIDVDDIVHRIDVNDLVGRIDWNQLLGTFFRGMRVKLVICLLMESCADSYPFRLGGSGSPARSY